MGEENIEAVYAEWRLGLELAAGVGIDQLDLDFVAARKLLERHGHVVLKRIMGSDDSLHSVVVYGIEHHEAGDPFDFSFLVVDPLRGDDKVHSLRVDYPAQFAFGLPQRGKPAACRTS